MAAQRGPAIQHRRKVRAVEAKRDKLMETMQVSKARLQQAKLELKQLRGR